MDDSGMRDDPLRKYAADEFGLDIMVGLTFAETTEATVLRAKVLANTDTRTERARFNELLSSHEKARIARVAAETK